MLFAFLWMRVLHVCMCSVYMHAIREVGIGFPGPAVTDDCEPPSGFWAMNPGPLQGQPVLLSAGTLSCIIFGTGIHCYISSREWWIYKSILFIHLCVSLHLGDLRQVKMTLKVFFLESHSPDRKVLHQGTTLAYLHFHFSRDSVWKNRSHIQISHDALGLLSDWVFRSPLGKQSIR